MPTAKRFQANPRGYRPNALVEGAMERRQPITLPNGLRPEVRKEAKAIIKAHPHLRPADTAVVVRLSEWRTMHDSMMSRIAAEGLTDSETGAANPLINAAAKAASTIAGIERSLALTITAARQHLTRAEQRAETPPAAPAQPKPILGIRLA